MESIFHEKAQNHLDNRLQYGGFQLDKCLPSLLRIETLDGLYPNLVVRAVEDQKMYVVK